MPRLPHGLVKQLVLTKAGVRVHYYWRGTVDDRDRKIALGDDYALALTRFKELERDPSMRTRTTTYKTPLTSSEPATPAPVLTVELFAKRWLAEYAASQRTLRGRQQAEQRFRDYLYPILGADALDGLKSADLRRLNSTLEAKAIGLVTRRRLLEDVRCMLRYAVEEAEVLGRSPWRPRMLPGLPESEPKPLNELALAEAVRVVPDRWRPVIQFLAFTGLRWGELRALRWEDVKETPYPHLVVSKSHSGPTKSGKVREVPLLTEAQEVLATQERGSGHVFVLPETASWLRRYVQSHSWVTDFHVHRLRHTFACRWLERGGTRETLQQVLGHSTIKLTERYGRLRPWAVAAEVARMSAAGKDSVAIPGTDLELNKRCRGKTA